MPRELHIPAKTIREEIRKIEEFPALGNKPGLVRVSIGQVDDNGEWVRGRPDEREIMGEDYEELTGPAEGGKPAGTYRNEDLWPFIDKLRAAPPVPPGGTGKKPDALPGPPGEEPGETSPPDAPVAPE